MVFINQDSELMTNYVGANPIPAGERFSVFRDADNDVGVFALSEDGVLELIMAVDGKTTKIDFGVNSGILASGAVVQAFAVAQSPGSTLDIAVAVAHGSSSDFYLLTGIGLSELQGPAPSSKITTGSGFPTVRHIFMV